MELKKFRNRYDLELIPASHEGIILVYVLILSFYCADTECKGCIR